MCENKKNKTLKEVWELKKISIKLNEKEQNFNFYVSEDDYMEVGENLLFNYQTHVLPQPYFGNIKDPEVVILAKNPKYDAMKSEDEFNNLFRDKITDKEIPHYLKDKEKYNAWFYLEKKEINNKTIEPITKNWWLNNVFSKKIENDDVKNLLDKVGIFNLCGYHSVTYSKLSKNITKEWLPTQQALKKHLKNDLNWEKVKLIIIVWGKKEWIEFLSDEPLKSKEDKSNLKKVKIFHDKNIIVVNESNYQNKSIIKYFNENNELREIFENCINEIKKNN